MSWILSNRIIISSAISLLALMLVLSTVSANSYHAKAATPTAATGIIVPLYTYPGSAWTTLVQTKNANPAVPVVAIINPNSGPGVSSDTNYVTGIRNLQAANIVVLGYVYTGYGSRSTSAVEADINSYSSWYHVNGIFFDEMSNKDGYQGYYSNLNNYVKSIGMAFTVGNPGADTLPSYIGTVDNIIIYENAGLPPLSYLGGWHTSYDKKNFSFLSYADPSLDTSYVASASSGAGYVYITNDNLPNPWDTLPPYFGSLVSAVGVADSGSSAGPPPAHYTVTVKSANLQGVLFGGMFTIVKRDSVTVQTGYTPLSFAAKQGSTYDVTVLNYRQHIFDHWDNGSKNPSRTITPSQSITLVAYYRN